MYARHTRSKKRAEQKSAARAGHYHCNVHKHRADKIQVAAADKDADHGYDHKENACYKVALLEKQHAALFDEFVNILDIKAEDHDNEQKSSGVQGFGQRARRGRSRARSRAASERSDRAQADRGRGRV